MSSIPRTWLPGSVLRAPATTGLGAAILLLAFAGLLEPPRSALAQDPAALAREGQAALGEGDAAAAVAAFEQAVSLRPDDGEIHYQLGLAYERLGRKEEAVASFRRVLSLSPDHAPARQALSRLGSTRWGSEEILGRADHLLAKQRYKEAAYLYRRHLQENAGSARAVLGLARCQEGLGEIEAALDGYHRALALEPGLTEARLRITQLEGAPGGEARPPEVAKPESGGLKPATPSPEPEAPSVEDEPAEIGPPATAPAATGETATSPEPGDRAAPRRQAAPPSPRGTLQPEAADETPDSTPGRLGSGLRTGLLTGLAGLAVVVLFLVWRHRRNYTVRGVLEQFPLVDLLQVLEQGRKEGVLKVTTPTRTGRIFFRSRIVGAEIEGENGEQAVYRILSLTRGRFVFREKALPPKLEPSLHLSVTQALMNWARMTDEAHRDRSEDRTPRLELVDESSLNVDLPF